MIPEAAVEAAFESLFAADAGMKEFKRATWLPTINKILEAAAPHMVAQKAIDAVLGLHREMPCLDEEGDPIGGSYCEECKDLDDHSGERVHEVYPCLTVREINAALAGDETFTAMRDRIEAEVAK